MNGGRVHFAAEGLDNGITCAPRGGRAVYISIYFTSARKFTDETGGGGIGDTVYLKTTCVQPTPPKPPSKCK